MIRGVGIDLCEVDRVERLCRNEASCRRVFTEAELAWAWNRKNRFEHLAGFFAAREAFVKATGLGLARVGLRNVSVVHDAQGRPSLLLAETDVLGQYRDARLHLSISHERSMAAAVVVYESEE